MKIRAKIGNFKLKWWNMIVEVYQKVWNRCTSKFNTMSSIKLSLLIQYDDVTINPTWWTAAILKIVISPYPTANRPNIMKYGIQMQILTKVMETWEKFRNSQTQDGGRMPYWKSFFGYNSAPYCLRLRRNLEWGGTIARIQRFGD